MARSLLLLSLGIVVIGCSPAPRSDRASVTGQVTYKGQTMTFGLVIFAAKDNPGLQDSCYIRPDGTYLLTNAPVGPVKVLLQINNAQDDQAYIARGEKVPPNPIPRELGKKYAKYETTPIELTVEPGEKKIDLEIK